MTDIDPHNIFGWVVFFALWIEAGRLAWLMDAYVHVNVQKKPLTAWYVLLRYPAALCGPVLLFMVMLYHRTISSTKP